MSRKKVAPIKDKAELAALLEHFRKEHFDLYILSAIGVNTGVSLEELRGLTVEDFVKSDYVYTNTRNRQCCIFSPDDVVLIKKYISELGDSTYLFASSVDSCAPAPSNSLVIRLKKYANSLGYNITFTTLRKTFAYNYFCTYKTLYGVCRIGRSVADICDYLCISEEEYMYIKGNTKHFNPELSTYKMLSTKIHSLQADLNLLLDYYTDVLSKDSYRDSLLHNNICNVYEKLNEIVVQVRTGCYVGSEVLPPLNVSDADTL